MISATIKRKNNYNHILKRIEDAVPIALNEVMKYGQNVALQKKRGSKEANLIPFEITVEGKTFTGKLHTNFAYAMFLEYGTGTFAELPHIGKTRLFKFSNFYCWYAPADAIKRQYSDEQFIDINGQMFSMNAYMNGKKYVMVFSSQPYPFMRPAAFELEEKAVKIFADKLKEQLRK